MAAYFLESSAAVKLYVVEQGSAWLTRLVDPTGDHDFFLARIASVEIAAAFFRRARARTLSRMDALAALSSLRFDLQGTYQFTEITPGLANQAVEMAERHGLRGYDCIQLAAALRVQRRRLSRRLSPIVLISADLELNAAAQAEGLTVENPNDHP